MKNYKVKAIINFDDIVDKTEQGTNTPRKVNDIFNCTKDRYIFLHNHKAVDLVGIDKEILSSKSKAISNKK